MDIPEAVVVGFEWVQEDLGYREFLVPAEVVNLFPVRLARDPDSPDRWRS